MYINSFDFGVGGKNIFCGCVWCFCCVLRLVEFGIFLIILSGGLFGLGVDEECS